MAQVDRVAASESRICILGETGTGKELIARALHERSGRRTQPFVTLNCAAVPAELIESELFGHEKGSFTGAATRHIGLSSNRRTTARFFLDEIGDMRFNDAAGETAARSRRRPGGTRGRRPYDCRRRAGDRRHAPQSGRAGQEGCIPAGFVTTQHRIYVFPLLLPALARSHRRYTGAGDALRGAGGGAEWVEAEAVRTRRNRRIAAIAQRGRAMCASWRNVVERLLLLADGPVDVEQVRLALPHNDSVPGNATPRFDGPLGQRVDAFEREQILAELKRHNQRMTDTAKALGLERSHLYKKCQALGIDFAGAAKGV